MTVLLWAGSFIAIRDGVQHISSLALASVRFFLAGAFSLCWIIFFARPKPGRAEIPRIALCGLIGIAIYNALLGEGEREVSASVASFMVATQTLFAAIATWTLEGVRPGRKLVVGAAIATIGVGIITFSASADGSVRGVVLTLFAAACSGLYFVIQRPVIAKLGPTSSAAATMLAGAIWLLPWAPEGISYLSQSREALYAVLYLGLAASVAGYAFWMVAIDKLGATQATLFLFLMAPIATFLEVARGEAALGQASAIGAILILLGVVASVVPWPRR